MNTDFVESYLAGHLFGPEYAALAVVVVACLVKAVGTVTTSYYSVRAAWRTFRAARARLAARALLHRQLLVEDLADALAGRGVAPPPAWLARSAIPNQGASQGDVRWAEEDLEGK